MMNGLLSGPFSIIFCGNSSCLMAAPDWSQAAIITIGIALGLPLFMGFSYLAVYFVDPLLGGRAQSGEEDILTRLAIIFMCVFGPPVLGIVVGGISLVYGIQHQSLGYAIGGGVVLGVTVIVLLGLLTFMPHYLAPILLFVVGQFVLYYGYQYSSQVVAIGGCVALVIGLIWALLIVRRRKSLA